MRIGLFDSKRICIFKHILFLIFEKVFLRGGIASIFSLLFRCKSFTIKIFIAFFTKSLHHISMDVTKKLLVCVDGSLPYMESCLKHAEWLMKTMGATADIFYVTDAHQFDLAMLGDFSGSLGAQPYQRLCEQLRQIEKEKVRVIQESVEKFFEKAGLASQISFHHEHGSLVDSCQKFENSEVGVDLILLGKRGENAAFAAEHLGANLERVVRASSRPCWIACRKFAPIQKMALAYDGSPSVHHGLQFLIRSPFLKKISIDLIYVCEEDNPSEEVQEMLDTAKKTLQKGGYEVQVVCLHDDIGDGISNYVSKNAIDLLMMGAYGHGKIRHLLIGSITTELMRRCKNSVLLFR